MHKNIYCLNFAGTAVVVHIHVCVLSSASVVLVSVSLLITTCISRRKKSVGLPVYKKSLLTTFLVFPFRDAKKANRFLLH